MNEINLLTTVQAARAADVSSAAVQQWIRSGVLKAYAVRIGDRGRRMWFVDPADLAAMPRTQAARKRLRQQIAPATPLPESVAVVHSQD